MEFLLANHPLDCPVCDQGGECDLQDQSMRYGSDRTRFHEFTGKRAVEDKNLGPLVKTVMTRCIQCTRCVRFANEVAGVDEFGTTGRGDNMQIGTYVERTLNSEMSGNIVDLCPVGALTSKPYAFTARPWELKKTESVDVLDAVGSNIRIDSRGTQVMRIQPRINDDINEEWINDKTRYAYDGLKFQRLTHPLIKQGDRFIPATWPEALTVIANGLTRTGAEGNEIKAVVGQLADTESMVALKDFVNQLGSDNLTLDQPLGDKAPAHGVDIRSNYLFNSTLAGAEEADLVLLVGTNPRHEAATLNSRFRKSYLNKFQDFALIGENFDSIFEYEHLGQDLKAVQSFVAGKGKFAERFAKARNPMIVIGSAVTEHAEGHAIISALAKFVNSHKATMLTPEWNGFNVLQRAASRAAAYEIGFVPAAGADTVKPKFIYLLNADEFDPASIPSDAFVVYQGHHGDVGAEYADVCLPGSAYTEKGSIYVNTEGRAQIGRAAIPPPGSSRDDWKIIRALSEVIGQPLPYDDFVSLHNRLWDISPTLLRHGRLEAVSPAIASVGLAQIASAAAPKNTKGARTGPLKDIIENFYSTDPISRNSVTVSSSPLHYISTSANVATRWHDAQEHLSLSKLTFPIHQHLSLL